MGWLEREPHFGNAAGVPIERIMKAASLISLSALIGTAVAGTVITQTTPVATTGFRYDDLKAPAQFEKKLSAFLGALQGARRVPTPGKEQEHTHAAA